MNAVAESVPENAFPSFRAMRETDIAAVCAIQERAYHAIVPESAAVMISKLQRGGDFCFVCEIRGAILGYVLAHPWRSGSCPALHVELTALPEDCDMVYIHDLALAPALRGRAAGRGLCDCVAAAARRHGWKKSYLIAIQGAAEFWTKCGYHPVAEHQDLSFYGADARLMERHF